MSNVIALAARRRSTNPLVYTVREAAALLNLSRGITYDLVNKGEIPAIRAGRRWVIPKKRFHAWLEGEAEEIIVDNFRSE